MHVYTIQPENSKNTAGETRTKSFAELPWMLVQGTNSCATPTLEKRHPRRGNASQGVKIGKIGKIGHLPKTTKIWSNRKTMKNHVKKKGFLGELKLLFQPQLQSHPKSSRFFISSSASLLPVPVASIPSLVDVTMARWFS